MKEIKGVETKASPSWGWILGCPHPDIPSREEVGKSHAAPFGFDDNGASSIWSRAPPPRPRLGSSLALTNQTQMCVQAGAPRLAWLKGEDDASAGRQKRTMSGRWRFPSHQTGTNKEGDTLSVITYQSNQHFIRLPFK